LTVSSAAQRAIESLSSTGIQVGIGGSLRPSSTNTSASRLWWTTAAAPARVGEHSDEVLAAAGYSAREIAALRSSGAIA